MGLFRGLCSSVTQFFFSQTSLGSQAPPPLPGSTLRGLWGGEEGFLIGMERVSNPVAVTKEEEEEMELPPGFRFHPTDEELITHYLSPKVGDSCFCARAIGEVDLNKCEPWELPWRAKMGEKEWYFFCVRDRKYPTGLRTNRATEAGYWKATGKDKEIYRARALVGMKKTLVFYRGRAPKGEKSNWVMHEYRLEGKYSYHLPSIAKNEWVICRVFEKTAGGKKVHISGLARLPPLMETSPNRGDTSGESDAAAAAARETPHVTCFSDPMEDQKSRTNLSPSSSSLNPPIPPPSVTSVLSSKISLPPSFYPAQQMPAAIGNLGFPCGNFSADQSILRLLFENYGMKQRERPEFSQDTVLSTDVNTDLTSVVSNHELIGEDLGACGGPVDLDCLWDY